MDFAIRNRLMRRMIARIALPNHLPNAHARRGNQPIIRP
jgi:hypothetical protein